MVLARLAAKRSGTGYPAWQRLDDARRRHILAGHHLAAGLAETELRIRDKLKADPERTLDP